MKFAVVEDQENSLLPLAERPLVTFALFAYNQEKYIREAVEGAFAQTYEPLEIILSDDCSTDRTFEIMKEMAEAYRGPHTIRLNRNPKNMGISPHVRHVHEMCDGVFIVHAAGDDISYPNRTDIIVRCFLDTKDPPSLVASNSLSITESGEEEHVISPDLPSTVRMYPCATKIVSPPGGGYTYAITKDLVDAFKAPDWRIIAEDLLLVARANLLNGSLYTPEVLVKYRLHDSSIWRSGLMSGLPSKAVINNEIKWASNALYTYIQIIDDLSFKGMDYAIDLKSYVMNHLGLVKISLTILQGSFFESAYGLMKMFVASGRDTLNKPLKLFLIRWFPFIRSVKCALTKSPRHKVARID